MQAVLRGAEVLVHEPRPDVPDARRPVARRPGSVVAAVETADRRARRARSASPSPSSSSPRSTASATVARSSIGDRLDADVAGARAAGLDGAIVLTGATTRRRWRARPTPRRRSSPPTLAELVLAARPVRRRTHHKHSSKKGYRRLLDRLAAHEAVHRVATGRVTPRMGAGRPVAPISKVRRVDSGLSITINTDGAMVDAYVDHRPPRRGRGLHARSGVVTMTAPCCVPSSSTPRPAAGAPLRALPAVEARLRALGVAFEVDATRDLEHAARARRRRGAARRASS